MNDAIRTDPQRSADPVVPLTLVGLPTLLFLTLEGGVPTLLTALGVALAGTLHTWTLTRRPVPTLAAASLALLLLPPDPVQILAPTALLILLTASQATRVPYLLALAAPAFLAPGPTGPWLAASALALLMAIPVRDPTATGANAQVHTISGGLLLAVGAAFAPVPALVGLTAGVIGRILVHHPGRARFGAALGRTGLWAALVPAALFLLVAAVGRVPPLGPRTLLAIGWAAVGLGGLTAVVVLGLEVAVRSSGQAPARGTALPLAVFGITALTVFQGDLTDAARLAGVAWAVVAPYAVIGTARLAHAAGPYGPWVGVAAAIVALLALPVRLLY